MNDGHDTKPKRTRVDRGVHACSVSGKLVGTYVRTAGSGGRKHEAAGYKAAGSVVTG